MKNFTGFLLIIWISSFSLLQASSVENDVKTLKTFVNKAYEKLSLSYDLDKATTNNKIFLQRAELSLQYAQINSSKKDFFNSDYMNLGLYLLSIRFKRYKAALVVLKKQLAHENNKKVKDWLKNRIERIENFLTTESYSNRLEFSKEISIFLKLFN